MLEISGLTKIDVELTSLQQDRLTREAARYIGDATALTEPKLFEGDVHIYEKGLRVMEGETRIFGFDTTGRTALIAGKLANGGAFYTEVPYGVSGDDFTRCQNIVAFINKH